ncbi:glucosaminidase domain-containing protein [Psychromonas ossibalaenae]|uniref:glucosaminidase domain-containing protein n=1 Tax=Psychromonas ossibalaenae TaxID=444922 RepID=UPI0003758B42|nr:glucosaminidase domain-containing protein [Psychromonas ossibalaenae]
MIKIIYRTTASLLVSTSLLLGGCIEHTEKETESETNTETETAAVPKKTPLITLPLEVSINSLTELNALFDKYQYSSEQWAKGPREVPRLTFSGISKKWQTQSPKLAVDTKKSVFFRLMTPLILISNEKILKERETAADSPLDSPELIKLALKYRIIKDSKTVLDETLRKSLLQRVDILPPSLALAQAAEESGWATSRFALEGNAFFGQWDFSGNGMKPKAQRKELGNYGVARFNSPLGSVEAYMLNLNSGSVYQPLRDLRAELRVSDQKISGYKLAGTLDKYSERGQVYAQGLQKMISYNELAKVDQAYLADNRLVHITSGN